MGLDCGNLISNSTARMKVLNTINTRPRRSPIPRGPLFSDWLLRRVMREIISMHHIEVFGVNHMASQNIDFFCRRRVVWSGKT
jgi:hypothetical protein